MPSITIRLDTAQAKKLSAMAKRRGKTKSATMREILDHRIETGSDLLAASQTWGDAILPRPTRRGRG